MTTDDKAIFLTTDGVVIADADTTEDVIDNYEGDRYIFTGEIVDGVKVYTRRNY